MMLAVAAANVVSRVGRRRTLGCARRRGVRRRCGRKGWEGAGTYGVDDNKLEGSFADTVDLGKFASCEVESEVSPSNLVRMVGVRCSLSRAAFIPKPGRQRIRGTRGGVEVLTMLARRGSGSDLV